MLRALVLISWLPFIAITGTNCFYPTSMAERFSRIYEEGDPLSQPSIAFIDEPPSEVVFSNWVGKEIQCIAQSTPDPQIEWLNKYDKPVKMIPGLRELRGMDTLYFPAFDPSKFKKDIHDTIYRCKATTVAGSIISRPIHVMSLYENYTVFIPNASTSRGNNVKLSCEVKPAYMKPYLFVKYWTRNGYPIQPGINNGGKHIFDTNSSDLIITSVDERDATNYTCVATDIADHQTPITASGIIQIYTPVNDFQPKSTNILHTMLVKLGDEAILAPIIEASPPAVITWYKKIGLAEKEIKGSSEIRIFGDVMVIGRVKVKHSGTYICQAVNKFGFKRYEINLEVVTPLSVRVTPLIQDINEGGEALFNCSARGTPVTRTQWLKNGRPVISDMNSRVQLINSEVLHIKNVSCLDRGMYQCFVENQKETVNFVTELRLGIFFPTFQLVFPPTTAEVGSEITLGCVARGNPIPRIWWEFNGQQIPENVSDSRFEILNSVDDNGDLDGSLTIQDVQPQDNGLYTCKFGNGVGEIKYMNKLHVHGGRTLMLPDGRIVANAGVNMTLTCPNRGFSYKSVQWKRNGMKIPQDMRHQLQPDGSLIVKNVDKKMDSGLYDCTVFNDLGSVSHRLDVIVQVAPTLQDFKFPTNVEEGGKVQVSCSLVNGDLPIQFTWLKDGELMPLNLNASITNNEFFSLLVFKYLTSAHSGNYSCIAKNYVASQDYTASLVVREHPKWINQPRDTEAFFGQDAEIQCSASGFPIPNITWYKSVNNNEYVDITFVPRVTVTAESKLELNTLTDEQEGNYLCQAENGVGPGLTKLVHVTVKEPPRFNIPNQNKTVIKGGNIDLSCDVYGDEPLDVEWTFNYTKPLTPNSRFSHIKLKGKKELKSELKTVNATRYDTGVYVCHAKNPYGENEFINRVWITEKPDPPIDVTPLQVIRQTVQFKWYPPFDGNSPIKYYIAQFKEIGAKWNKTHNIHLNMSLVSEHGHVYLRSELNGFKPRTTYKIRLAAVNALGKGNYSDPFVTRTDDAAPVGIPFNVTVETLNSTALFISWTPPSMETWNSDHLDFIVICKPLVATANLPTLTKTVSGVWSDVVDCVVNKLSKFTDYGITVAAYNPIGIGPSSATIRITTAEDVPEIYPANITCTVAGPRILIVSWSRIPQEFIGGVMLGYKVHYRPYQFCNSVDVTAEPEVKRTENTITNLNLLLPYTNYSIQVLAYTRVGDGPISRQIYCQTDQDIPDAPSKIKSDVISDTAIMVLWLPPITCNGIILKYNLYYREQDRIGKETSISIAAASTALVEYSYVISNVIPSKVYEIRVSATTAIGEGPSTAVILQSAGLRAPSKLISFSQHIYKPKNSRVILPCKAVGFPRPKTEWRFESRRIKYKPYYSVNHDGDLEISVLKPNMEGNYHCIATNLHEIDQVNFTLTVILPPKEPRVFVKETTTNSIEIQWSKPETNGADVRGYTVNIKEYDSQWVRQDVSSEVSSHAFYNLVCGTEHYVTVTAHNGIGEGIPSEMMSIRTKGGMPKQPKREELFTTNNTFFIMNLNKWPDGGCKIETFEIQYKERDSQDWIKIEPNNTSVNEPIVVDNLEPNKTYYVSVVAANEAGTITTDYEVDTLPINSNQDGWFAENRMVIIEVVGIIITVLILAIILHRMQSKNKSPLPKHMCYTMGKRRASVELQPAGPADQASDHSVSPIPSPPPPTIHQRNAASSPMHTYETCNGPRRPSIPANGKMVFGHYARPSRSPMYRRQLPPIPPLPPRPFASIPMLRVNNEMSEFHDYVRTPRPRMPRRHQEETFHEGMAFLDGPHNLQLHRISRSQSVENVLRMTRFTTPEASLATIPAVSHQIMLDVNYAPLVIPPPNFRDLPSTSGTQPCTPLAPLSPSPVQVTTPIVDSDDTDSGSDVYPKSESSDYDESSDRSKYLREYYI